MPKASDEGLNYASTKATTLLFLILWFILNHHDIRSHNILKIDTRFTYSVGTELNTCAYPFCRIT